MNERRENTQRGYNFTLTAIAPLETFAQALFNFVMAPTNASSLLIAAKECVHSAWLPFIRGSRGVLDSRR